ncbi:2-hydroxyacid dehydrogenase [Pseudogemmobacter sp. W21_MBD1_M6]|uniref:2-hydroxyacid dehydrogenase n=1 Tax=Pseudogemmobacter sp. W21_MBD1_M6 TaxID=3240271 RepID=UPI003F97C6F4
MVFPVAVLEPMNAGMQAKVRTAAGPDLDLRFTASAAAADMAAVLADVEFAVVRAVALPAALLGHAPNLRLIHQWGTGTDGIPVSEARARGIQVARSPGLNAPTVADLALGLMLAVARRIPQTDAGVRAGAWAPDALWDQAFDLCEARVGLVGFGAIGQMVANRLAGFGATVSYTRASGPVAGCDLTYAPLDALLAGSDVVSLHVPLTPDTRNLINATRLAAMKPGAILINTSRGGLVDEAALAAALASGHLGGAGLDVFATEPLADDSPLRDIDSLVMLPHVGGRTRHNLDRMVGHWAGNIRIFAQGGQITAANLV